MGELIAKAVRRIIESRPVSKKKKQYYLKQYIQLVREQDVDFKKHFDKNSENETAEENVEEYSVPRLDLNFPKTVDESVEHVYKIKSSVNTQVQAEGVVWWNRNGETFDELGDRSNFKAINNAFLMKHGG